MKLNLVLACLTALFAFSTQAAQAQIAFDFDAADAGFEFGFSENDALTFTTSRDGVGNNGTEGWTTTTDAVAAQPGFAGIGIGNLDLAGALGVAPGTFTADDFADLIVSFDYLTTIGAGINSPRLDVSGNFGTRLEFPAELETTTAGVWETFTLNFSDAVNIDAFLPDLNSTAGDAVQFQVSLTAGSDGVFAVGDTVSIDNFSIAPAPAAIPEPSSAVLGMMVMAFAGATRRRRR